jgi:hypothetical protein
MCNFNYGYKYYRNKLQISNLIGSSDLYLHNPLAKMKEKCEMAEKRHKHEGKKCLKEEYKVELLTHFETGLPAFYSELLNILF